MATDKDWVPRIGLVAANAASITDGWRSRLILSDKGKQLPILANAITALHYEPEWTDVLAFDEFSLNIITQKPTPWGSPPAIGWTDRNDYLAAEWLQHRGILVNSSIANQAIITVAGDRRFHPVRNYLNALKWDGIPRIDRWLTFYLGTKYYAADHFDAKQNLYDAAVGSRFLIAAVARIFDPGCKMDTCLVLESPQGAGKSTAFEILAGREWFTDHIPDLGTKDASLQTQGKWIIEMSELRAMRREIQIENVKEFLSRKIDDFRPPYGRHNIKVPRQCVFGGTTNHDRYLNDETGGRRFWPVKCAAKIRIKELAEDRDQLWAEARDRYLAGNPWWLDTDELDNMAAEHQSSRYEGDAWDELIIDWAMSRISTGSTFVTMPDILGQCLDKQRGQWTKGDEMRVAKCLKSKGWDRVRGPRPDRNWRYTPPVVGTSEVGAKVGAEVGATESVDS